jgi:16S rRNA (guanine527-N7)-methyltransferase
MALSEDHDGFGPGSIAALQNVSRETFDHISAFLDELAIRGKEMNLMGPAEGRHLWRRHVWDSLQLLPFLPHDTLRIADMGSGAGFPGMILACALRGVPGAKVSLIEKSPKKCAFLSGCVRRLDLPAEVIRQSLDQPPETPYPVVVARALAPADRLLGYAADWMRPDGLALFLKGASISSELTAARESWTFDYESHMSRSGPDGRILKVTSIRRRAST